MILVSPNPSYDEDRGPISDAVFRALQHPYHARSLFCWPKTFRVTYHENRLFWGIRPSFGHQKLSLNGSFSYGSTEFFTLYTVHILAGLHFRYQ